MAQFPLAQSISIYDANGDLLVSTTVQPPPYHNFADRDFVAAPEDRNVYGRVLQPAVGRQPFHSSRTCLATATSKGPVKISISPSNFFQFLSPRWLTPRACDALIRGGRHALGAFAPRPRPARPTGWTKRPASAAPSPDPPPVSPARPPRRRRRAPLREPGGLDAAPLPQRRNYDLGDARRMDRRHDARLIFGVSGYAIA